MPLEYGFAQMTFLTTFNVLNGKIITKKTFLPTVLVDQSDNATVMEGMRATFTCQFESDLAVLINWLRPSKKALEDKMETFDPKDPKSFDYIRNPITGQPEMGKTLVIEDTKLSDSGLYFCVGLTNSGFTPGILHLKVTFLYL